VFLWFDVNHLKKSLKQGVLSELELLLEGNSFLIKDHRDVPRPKLMKKVNGVLFFLDRLMRLGTPFLMHFGVSISNRKQKYFMVFYFFELESFYKLAGLVFRFNFIFFNSELYIFKKLTVYRNELSGNPHHYHLKSHSEQNS